MYQKVTIHDALEPISRPTWQQYDTSSPLWGFLLAYSFRRRSKVFPDQVSARASFKLEALSCVRSLEIGPIGCGCRHDLSCAGGLPPPPNEFQNTVQRFERSRVSFRLNVLRIKTRGCLAQCRSQLVSTLRPKLLVVELGEVSLHGLVHRLHAPAALLPEASVTTTKTLHGPEL